MNLQKLQTNKKSIKFFVLPIIILLLPYILNAQVTIGAGEKPEKAAILDVKRFADTEGEATVGEGDGGILLPRVELEKKKELYPFIREVGYDPGNFGNPNYNSNNDAEYAKQKLVHKGLVVYNLKEDDEEDLCFGFNIWDGEQWNCTQEKMGNAIVEIADCNKIKFEGKYLNDVHLDGSNFLTLPLQVTKAGAYNILVKPQDDNGYYFLASGVFAATGYHVITIPGAGTPINYTTIGENGDLMTIVFNNKPLSSCDPLYVFVDDSSKKPLYMMDCRKTTVKGVYMLDVPLDSETNYIEMTLNVDLEAIGATYSMQTNTVDGIYFKGEGLLTSTTQVVKLHGYGTPASMDDKEFTISSNSTKSAITCKTTVNMTIQKKRILVLGSGSLHGYNISLKNTGAHKVFMSENNFGNKEHSIVKYEGTEWLNYNSPFSTTYTASFTTAEMNAIKDAINKDRDNIDIIVLTQDVYVNASEAEVLADFVRKKGVLICFWEANLGGGPGSAANLARAIFKDDKINQVLINRSGAVYEITNKIDDEILNGPFGDVRGKVWGEDASATKALANLPLDEIDVYSTGVNVAGGTSDGIEEQVTGFKHKKYNLVWFGDGGFNSSGTNGLPHTSTTICPFWWDTTTMFPIPNLAYGYQIGYNVYNSIVFCNVMAWAIKQAEFDGINTIR